MRRPARPARAMLGRNGHAEAGTGPVVERFDELHGGLKPVLDVARHPLADDEAERRIEIGNHGERRRRRGENDLEEQLVERLGVERHLAGDGLVEDDADRVEVAARVDRRGCRGPARATCNRACPSPRRCGSCSCRVAAQRAELRDAEVEDLDEVAPARLLVRRM